MVHYTLMLRFNEDVVMSAGCGKLNFKDQGLRRMMAPAP